MKKIILLQDRGIKSKMERRTAMETYRSGIVNVSAPAVNGEMSVKVSLKFAVPLLAMGILPAVSLVVIGFAPLLVLIRIVGEYPESWGLGAWLVYAVMAVIAGSLFWKYCLSYWLDSVTRCTDKLTRAFPKTARHIILA